MMVREKILEVLKDAKEPISADELSARVGAPVLRVRAELLRLMGEKKVDGRQKGGQMVWSLRLGTSTEQRYDKMAKKLTA